MKAPAHHFALGALVLALLAFGAYLPAIAWGSFIWTDDANLVKNPHLTSTDGLRRIWLSPRSFPEYEPLTKTTFWVEYQLGLRQPLGYHLANVVLHAINAVLVWLILRRLLVPGALLAAAIFAVHPVNVEAVAWVSERSTVLSGALALGCILALLRFYGIPWPGGGDASAAPRPRAWLWYVAALALLGGSLLSNSVTCVVPVVALVLVWWKLPRLRMRDITPLLPMFAAGATAGILAARLEQDAMIAQGDVLALTLIDRILVSGRAIWYDIATLLSPLNLSFMYPRWTIARTGVGPYLFPAAAAALIVVFWLLRRRAGSGPLVALVVFIVTLAPVLGFVNHHFMQYTFVADHFLYLAGVSMIALLAAAWMVLIVGEPLPTAQAPHAGAAGPGYANPLFSLVVPMALVAILAAMTWNRAGLYEKPEALWRDTVAKNRDGWIPLNNLGAILIQDARIGEAVDCYTMSIQNKPDFAETHFNLGSALTAQGKVEEAINYYQSGLSLQPDYLPARHNLATLLMSRGQNEEAAIHLQEAIRIRGDSVAARFDLAELLRRQGKLADSADQYREILKLDDSHNKARYGLAECLLGLKKFSEAALEYQACVERDPGSFRAWQMLGACLIQTGRVHDGITKLRKAMDLAPDDRPTRLALGRALLLDREFEGSVAMLTPLAAADPSTAPDSLTIEATMTIGEAQFHLKNYEQAKQAYEAVVRSDPARAAARRLLARTLDLLGHPDQAASVLREGLALKPSDADLAYQLAWILASDPDAALRDGQEAVRLAELASAAAQRGNPGVLHLLACAYAEAGRFDDAVKAAEDALKAANEAKLTQMATEIEERLALFRDHKPCRAARTKP